MITDNVYDWLMNTLAEVKAALDECLGGDPVSGSAAVCAEYYRRLRVLKDEAEAVAKQLSKEVESYGMGVLPETFEREGVTTMNLASGYRVTISEVVRASIPADTKPLAYDWLVNNDLGDLITSTVNASTLSATAKELIKQGRELPEGLFKVAVLPQVSMTKLK